MRQSQLRYTLTKVEKFTDIEIALEANILSVNDRTDTFEVALLIHALFRDEQCMKGEGAEDTFIRAEYHGIHPHIGVINAVKYQHPHFERIYRINEVTGEVWMAMYNTVIIGESLELSKFPFDRQLFRIKIRSLNCRLKPWTQDPLLLNFRRPTKQNVARSQDTKFATYLITGSIKQWKISGINVSYNPDQVDPVSLNASQFTVAIKAERDPHYFFYNFMFIVYLIGAANVALVSVDNDEIIARNTVTITTLLALITFKYVTIQNSPKVSYMTYMDRYITSAFIYILLSVLVNIVFSTRFLCICNGLTSEDQCDQQVVFDILNINVDLYDFYTHLILLGFWTLYHIVLWIIVGQPSLLRTKWKDLYAEQNGHLYETTYRTREIFNEAKAVPEKPEVQLIPSMRQKSLQSV